MNEREGIRDKCTHESSKRSGRNSRWGNSDKRRLAVAREKRVTVATTERVTHKGMNK